MLEIDILFQTYLITIIKLTEHSEVEDPAERGRQDVISNCVHSHDVSKQCPIINKLS